MNYKFVYAIEIILYIVESKKPFGKHQQETWRLECELGMITDSECPIDGGWSPWTSWSNCNGACDYVGYRRRTRECTNPSTSKEGIPCAGQNEQIDTCYIKNCSAEDFRKLIKRDISRTEAMEQLEVVPALLERCLQMECTYEAMEAALSSDNPWQLNPEILWNSLQCVKHNLGCPIKGEWGMWGSWSTCGARCGKGLRWRLRRCDTPPPSDGTLICAGTPLQSEECAGDQCALGIQYTNYVARGAWSEWTQWSICSEKCGSGVRQRKRTCLESHIPLSSFAWGTHCRGQLDQFEICINNRCSLDGGWSGWGPWSPCSQTCGAGRRTRTRSCTKPLPSGEGKDCLGLRTETGSCYLEPCEVYNHIVAIFNGESYLQYNLHNKKTALFHFYIRFMPLSQSGTLLRRGSLQSSSIRLSLQKWHICLETSGVSQSCSLSRICCTAPLEAAVWHTTLITVNSVTASIRIDNGLMTTKRDFPCDPELESNAVKVYIGERFNGQIQELLLNFKQLELMTERNRKVRNSDHLLNSALNVVYEKANMIEAFILLENEHFLRVPCFKSQDEWRVELTVKPKTENGLILFFQDQIMETFLYMTLQNMRIKVKLTINDFISESVSATDYTPDQWLDIILSKKRGFNTIESIINAGERIHLKISEHNISSRRRAVIINNKPMKRRRKNTKSTSFCNDEFFLGNVPVNIVHEMLDDFAPFSGVLASLSINGILLDLHNCSLEYYKDNNIKLSSRTASVSHNYHETAWGISNILNLTCLHSRITQSHNSAYWLFLDTTLREVHEERIVNDGKILKLMIRKTSDLKGFYTCRAHSNRNTYNVITYGVLGEVNYNLNSPDITTIIAVLTTVTLVVCTLSWLISEGINDLRNGYGFFRDAHFSPQQEAEAVCKFIDQNIHYYRSESAITLAKTRARRKGRQLSSKISFGAQEPQGILQLQSEISETINESESSDLETLPALPNIKNSRTETSRDIYRYEASYESSSMHGSIKSLEMSPRALCSRLLLTKYKYRSKQTIRSRRNKTTPRGDAYINQSKLLTIKSSTLFKLSPAQKILQKFHDLKREDS